MQPSYIALYKTNRLKERIQILYNILENCQLCPRKCGVNRLKGEKGYCKSTAEIKVSSIFPHFGEEPELVGKYGSGTIFLTNCNLGCLYCQNYDISHFGEGEIMSVEELAKGQIYLQKMGCHNINFVTPTHFIPQIVESVFLAAQMGLNLPLVYNCGGYENVEVIKLLEGIFDIYMPDIKYSSSEDSKKYSNAQDYFERAKESVLEMYRQTGDLKVVNGIAIRGLIIRHLVLPNDVAGSKEVLRFIAEEISKDSYVNIMDQYRPLYRAFEFDEINRPITNSEYYEVIKIAKDFGLHRGF
jgi:putative pyruvate formate lyase activating enzyme